MTLSDDSPIPDLHSDPFYERSPGRLRRRLRLLGTRLTFATDSPRLLRLVDSAYAGLPPHGLPGRAPRLTVRLVLEPRTRPPRRGEPPALAMLSGAGLLAGATDSASFALISPRERAALVALSPRMLRYPYHARYELLEFAVFTLAARVRGLVALHAACVGRGGRGVLLMGGSGAGKSTLALLCLEQGLQFLAEDSVFVAPASLCATGIANFLHVRADSLRWLAPRQAARIRRSPIVRRRSGVRKFEVDLRRGGYRLARRPLPISAVVFLTAEPARDRPLLARLAATDALRRLAVAQAYAANQPGWTTFARRVLQCGAFVLRRGHHPLESVTALGALLEPRNRQRVRPRPWPA